MTVLPKVTHSRDLGHGWVAHTLDNGDMCLEEPATGNSFVLPAASVERLRFIVTYVGQVRTVLDFWHKVLPDYPVSERDADYMRDMLAFSPCGMDCCKAIRQARMFLETLDPVSYDSVVRATKDTVITYIAG